MSTITGKVGVASAANPSGYSVVDNSYLELARKMTMELVESDGSSHAAVFPIIDYTLRRLAELSYLRATAPVMSEVSLQKCIDKGREFLPSRGFHTSQDPGNAKWAQSVMSEIAKAILDAAGVKYVD